MRHVWPAAGAPDSPVARDRVRSLDANLASYTPSVRVHLPAGPWLESRSVWRLQVTPSAARLCATVAPAHERGRPVEPASALIDDKIKQLGDWRGKMFAKVRGIIHEADPEIVEEWKWAKATSPGTPVFSHGGIVCTGETYKNVVKLTFAKGAALKDPSRLFNSSLDGNVRRAIDIHEGDKINEAALKDLIRAAVALNLKGKSQPKPKARRPSSKRAS